MNMKSLEIIEWSPEINLLKAEKRSKKTATKQISSKSPCRQIHLYWGYKASALPQKMNDHVRENQPTVSERRSSMWKNPWKHKRAVK